MQLSSSSIPSTAAAGVPGGGSSSINEIEQLQRQLKHLQKSMAELPSLGLPPDQAKTQAQVLSMQIQIVQAQIERLQARKGLEQAETQVENRHKASDTSSTSNTSATARARTTDKVTGSSTAADARLQARQAQAAQPAHPASAEAIEPAEPPLVSVKV
ncbi:FlxA-like family protein (plasmid) [Ralstonia sp. 25C]|uniref:FlxA-like family protein n=1 Tax=Ralstonia sp. 25C TaxID=3447363 RepID=UPI003F74E129